MPVRALGNGFSKGRESSTTPSPSLKRRGATYAKLSCGKEELA